MKVFKQTSSINGHPSFQQEVSFLSQLDHPNIVKVRVCSETDTQPDTRFAARLLQIRDITKDLGIPLRPCALNRPDA